MQANHIHPYIYNKPTEMRSTIPRPLRPDLPVCQACPAPQELELELTTANNLQNCRHSFAGTCGDRLDVSSLRSVGCPSSPYIPTYIHTYICAYWERRSYSSNHSKEMSVSSLFLGLFLFRTGRTIIAAVGPVLLYVRSTILQTGNYHHTRVVV